MDQAAGSRRWVGLEQSGYAGAMGASPYRDGKWTTAELQREREHLQWLLAEVDLERSEEEVRERGVGYLLGVLREIDEEVERRERLAASRHAPRVRKGPTVDRPELIRRIREWLPAEELLRRYGVQLERRGKNLVCRCPLPGHEERTPPFNVFLDGGWYCFGCQRGGDVFELARWMRNMRSFVEVVERLEREVGS